jgi:hypothetical protein
MSANLCVESHFRALLEGGFEVPVVRDATAAALLIGLVAAIFVLRHLMRKGSMTKHDAGFGSATPSPIRLAIAVGLGFALYVLQGAPSLHPMVLTNAFAQVLIVSAAEVIVRWALAGAAVETSLRARGRAVSIIGAAIVTSILFGAYQSLTAPLSTRSRWSSALRERSQKLASCMLLSVFSRRC